jgi:hypothetical protein
MLRPTVHLHLFISPGDVGEHQHSTHRRRIDIGFEERFPGRRRNAMAFSKPSIHSSPRNETMSP